LAAKYSAGWSAESHYKIATPSTKTLIMPSKSGKSDSLMVVSNSMLIVIFIFAVLLQMIGWC
jgi:hypothetical protein